MIYIPNPMQYTTFKGFRDNCFPSFAEADKAERKLFEQGNAYYKSLHDYYKAWHDDPISDSGDWYEQDIQDAHTMDMKSK